MRAVLAPIAVLMLKGCAETVAPGTRFVTGGSIGDFAVPVESLQERRFSGVIRQRYDFSCGSAALATLLHYHYGDASDEAMVFKGMWRDGDRDAIRGVGFSLLDMKRYLAARQLKADGYKVPLDAIAKTGVPGIALISVRNYKHFVVIKGVTPTEVLVGDPSMGLQVVNRAAFQSAWNGVYFVVNSELGRGRAAFNQPTQWAAFTRAPVGSRFHDPVSLQALALTAPFYRDF